MLDKAVWYRLECSAPCRHCHIEQKRRAAGEISGLGAATSPRRSTEMCWGHLGICYRCTGTIFWVPLGENHLFYVTMACTHKRAQYLTKVHSVCQPAPICFSLQCAFPTLLGLECLPENVQSSPSWVDGIRIQGLNALVPCFLEAVYSGL